jgi:hypothetical protein
MVVAISDECASSLQAAISLADSWSIPLTTEFSTAGQPLSMKLEIEGISADLTIATQDNDAFKDLRNEMVASSNKPPKPDVSNPRQGAAAGQPNRVTGKTPMKKKSLHFSRDAPVNFPQAQMNHDGGDQDERQPEVNDENQANEPLFYPGGSQDFNRPLSQAQLMQAASQRELDSMDPEVLAGIFEQDEEELEAETHDYVEVQQQAVTTSPYKRRKAEGSAEELLGKSILDIGDEDTEEDTDEEAPPTITAQQGETSVRVATSLFFEYLPLLT